jgi:hypothetical protein
MSRVRVHDFLDPALGKAIPYGVDDLAADEGWVPVGIDHDTAQLAVASIRGWWEHLGGERYPQATSLTITADCGGSNGSRARLWKTELKRLADETGLEIRSSISPRYEQVEQDRASPVQFHQPELARQAADQPPGHHQPDRPRQHPRRPSGLCAA